MRHLTVVVVAVLACMAYVVQAKTGPLPPEGRFDDVVTPTLAAGPGSQGITQTESAP